MVHKRLERRDFEGVVAKPHSGGAHINFCPLMRSALRNFVLDFVKFRNLKGVKWPLMIAKDPFFAVGVISVCRFGNRRANC